MTGAELNKRDHLNVFIEAPVLEPWASRLGIEPPVIVRSGEAGAAGLIVQSVAVLRRPGRTA